MDYALSKLLYCLLGLLAFCFTTFSLQSPSSLCKVPINKIESDLLNHKYDYRKSCYQLIKTMTKFEKQNKHRLNAIMNKDITVDFF